MSGFDRNDFANEPDVSRETLQAFDAWNRLLTKWNRSVNLVAQSTLSEFWSRHALDSWQLTRLVPESAKTAIDLGSGAGFPGIALGIAFKANKSGEVLLVESAGKKATFLRNVVRELDLPVRVTHERAEDLPNSPYDVVSARAFAPMPRLLGHAERFWGEGTVGIFPKGETAEAEIAEARKIFGFEVDSHVSRTSDQSRVLVVRELQRTEVGHG